jgi:uncharacterized protein
LKNSQLKIGNITIQPGEKITLALPTPELYTCAPFYIPVHVFHGIKAGPTLLICGAIHGDEVNGVAIIQKLVNLKTIRSLKGTLIVIPTMNIYGLMTLSRNLPDRQDLDGSFPGSETGSFAARLAHMLTEEVFSHITHCIDLHTGEPHITKFPYIKTLMDHPVSRKMALDFHAPVILNTDRQNGLLWLLHRDENPIPTVIFETGEALRLDAKGIKVGLRGIVRVMRSIDMLPAAKKEGKKHSTIELQEEIAVRSPSSGLCERYCKLGSFVKKGQRLAKIFDPFGTNQREEVFAPFNGIVLGMNTLPILNEGEPIFKLAEVKKSEVDSMQQWSSEADEAHSLE